MNLILENMYIPSTFLIPDERHHKHMKLQQKSLRTWYPRYFQPLQITQLLFRPQFHHLSRIRLAIPVSESKFSSHIAIPILEYKNRSLVNFDCALLSIVCHCVVHVCFLSRGDTPVDCTYEVVVYHFEEYHSGAGV